MTDWPAERCTCVAGRIGLCGACTIYMMSGGPKPLPRFEEHCPVCHNTGMTYDVTEQRNVPCGGLECSVES